MANQFYGANQIGSAGATERQRRLRFGGTLHPLAQRGAGALNFSGSGMVTTPWLAMVGWTYSLSTGTVNLSGGTLAVGAVRRTTADRAPPESATFNFNGGLLRATASNASFLQGLDYAYVQSGGAMIDTQGFNDAIGQALQSGAANDGGLTKFGAGTLTLLASNTYTGPTTVYGGLQLGDGSADTGSVAGNIVLMNSAMLTFANPVALVYANSISGTGNLVKTGPGLLTLSGTNTYAGTTTISGGELIFSASNSAPTAATLPDISIAGGAVLAASGPYSTVTAWLSSGRISPSSSGTLSLTASSNLAINLNTAGYTGLVVGSIGTNTYTGTFTPAAATYCLGGPGGTLVMPNNGALVDSGGPRGLVVNGGLTLAGSNSYSGGSTLTPLGQLNVNNAAALGTGTLTIAGGTLGNTSGATVNVSKNNPQGWNGDFTFAGPNALNLGGGAVAMNSSRTLTVTAGTLTVGGPICGAGAGLSLAGAGHARARRQQHLQRAVEPQRRRLEFRQRFQPGQRRGRQLQRRDLAIRRRKQLHPGRANAEYRQRRRQHRPGHEFLRHPGGRCQRLGPTEQAGHVYAHLQRDVKRLHGNAEPGRRHVDRGHRREHHQPGKRDAERRQQQRHLERQRDPGDVEPDHRAAIRELDREFRRRERQFRRRHDGGHDEPRLRGRFCEQQQRHGQRQFRRHADGGQHEPGVHLLRLRNRHGDDQR